MSIKDFLPEKKKSPQGRVQAFVDLRLYKAVHRQIKLSGITWGELIEACFKDYLRETIKERKDD